MRISFVRAMAVGAVAGLALAACGSSSKSSSSPTTTAGSTAAAATTSPTSASSTAAGATVALASTPVKDFGTTKILVDGKGMTLYIWDNDKTAGKADCTGVCAQAWPALYVTGTPVVGSGLNAAMFTTVTGPNGSKQLAVNGKPLYLWKADTKAGEATGQGVNGFYVVNAQGMKDDKR